MPRSPPGTVGLQRVPCNCLCPASSAPTARTFPGRPEPSRAAQNLPGRPAPSRGRPDFPEPPSAAPDMAEDNRFAPSSSLRLILVGTSGCGKSATGNSILCQPVFESKLGAQAVTRKCQKATGTWNGRSILVVDTAPIFAAKAHGQEMYEDIGDCYVHSAPGPHVLLLVTQLGRFTARDTEAVRRVKEVFGAGAMRHVVVVFTHKEDLGGESLDEYVRSTDNCSLQSLIRECEGRYCGFNNRATGEEQRGQLEALMAVVERLEREHQGTFYKNDLYLEAKEMQGRVGKERKDYLAKVRMHVKKQKRDLKKTETGSKWLPNKVPKFR